MTQKPLLLNRLCVFRIRLRRPTVSPNLLILLLILCLGGVTEALAQRAFGGGGARGVGASRGASGTRQYPGAGQIGDALISVDPETRSIIVIGDDPTLDAISQVVTNLDKPRPQVLIKVVFLEVTHNDGLDLGVEGSYSHKISNSTTGTVSTLFGLAQQTSGGFYRVLSDNFQVTLRAIQNAAKTEVLSRPSILARNNQLATITVGQRIPLIIGSTTSQSVGITTQNQIEYRDIGIILEVTPFITADGMVEMIISPEISSLVADTTVAVAANVFAPVIATRSADTVVITPDGQPVVIGGLMQTQQVETTQKVPLLGDIPLLGWAFKRKVKSNAKTELIIILLPHIVNTPKELAAMSDRERSQTKMAPNAFPEEELDRFIDGLPVKKETAPNAKPAPKKKSSGTKRSQVTGMGRGNG